MVAIIVVLIFSFRQSINRVSRVVQSAFFCYDLAFLGVQVPEMQMAIVTAGQGNFSGPEHD